MKYLTKSKKIAYGFETNLDVVLGADPLYFDDFDMGKLDAGCEWYLDKKENGQTVSFSYKGKPIKLQDIKVRFEVDIDNNDSEEDYL